MRRLAILTLYFSFVVGIGWRLRILTCVGEFLPGPKVPARLPCPAPLR